ncbi:MAG: bifunctional proline dehydrogenase/L-glutamate gamma-semialdehyde dehydrogenase [Propionibacteriaceae bacterium]|nr:bifunctional proline dehydrogenase/L-glutamate gamma-semialdehyde dehydrogenase [Propionibacteriaceae bacterium]
MSQDVHDLAPDAIDLVRQWLTVSDTVRAPWAARQLASMLRDPAGLEFTVGFVDQVIRPEDLQVAATNMARLASTPPAFLDWYLRAALRIGGFFAPKLPSVVVPIARRVLRQLVSHLIIDADDAKLTKSIRRIKASGVSLNLNLLGEAVLGDQEADRRLLGTTRLLARDDVDYVSIKVSATIAPQQRWGFDATVEHVIERLRPLYRLAASSPAQKFINLDMEEYKDLELTIAVFTRLLSEPEFVNLRAGIVLQAYLPDALPAMMRLQEWAAARVDGGGAPIKVRLVKGANLPMEQVEAELHGWPLATCGSKQETDTNYKRVMDYALRPERIRNVNLGVAGHNLFDLALAWKLGQRRGVTSGLEFEMLVGMAPGQAEAVRRTVGGLLLYVPVVRAREFDVAIAYLIRRLEEGASQQNFMSAVFELTSQPDLFEREKNRFLAAIADLSDEVPSPNRVQSRLDAAVPLPHDRFVATADSDPSVLANQEWATQLRDRIAANSIGTDLVASSQLGSEQEIDQVIETALAAQWRNLSGNERADILHRAGDILESRRGDLMVVAADECGKTLDQSDPEVSEAIDFAHYYAELARGLDKVDGAKHTAARLIVVTPPWNFPLAIPAGSMLAGLAAGAAVIAKPARAAARCGAAVVEALWEAGVPRDALQYVQTTQSCLGSKLVADERVDRVILTGGYETAQMFTELRPEIGLVAETSGKNAIIVTPHADLDLAVKDVLSSAFGHAGQKCSASSLVVLVGQVARSERFISQLRDGARSIEVGLPSVASAEVGPIIGPASGKLLKALTTLDPGERWLVTPERMDDEGRLWRPGVRTGVARGSEFHLVEYFGPVLGIMTAESLDEAIDIVNEVDYGLTSGLHSLDRDEIGRWLERINAGNLYVNRGITGAIVQRQPFGGWKRSVVGATTKAGGPNYLIGLSDWTPVAATASTRPELAAVNQLLQAASSEVDGEVHASLVRAARSDQEAWDEEFGQARDVQQLAAERNLLRYRPFGEAITIRRCADGSLGDMLRVCLAAMRAGQRPLLSVAEDLPGGLRSTLVGLGFEITTMSDEQFAGWLADAPAGRVRLVGTLPSRPGRADLAVYSGKVTEAGRVEGLIFYSEQAVSITAHRFGTPNQLTHGLI